MHTEDSFPFYSLVADYELIQLSVRGCWSMLTAITGRRSLNDIGSGICIRDPAWVGVSTLHIWSIGLTFIWNTIADLSLKPSKHVAHVNSDNDRPVTHLEPASSLVNIFVATVTTWTAIGIQIRLTMIAHQQRTSISEINIITWELAIPCNALEHLRYSKTTAIDVFPE